MAYQQGDTPLPRQRRPQPKAQPMPQAPGGVTVVKAPGLKTGPVKPTTGGGLQSPKRPAANVMPNKQVQVNNARQPGMRDDLIQRVRGVVGLSPNDQAALTAAVKAGGRGALRSAVMGKPYEQDVLQAINGNVGAEQNAPGARPVSGGASSGAEQVAVGGGAPAVGGGAAGAGVGAPGGMPVPGAPPDPVQAGLMAETPGGVSAEIPAPVGGPQSGPLPMGAPAQPGSDSAQVPGGAGSNVPMGGITSVWNPEAREKLAAERGWGFVQQVQDAMTAATQGLPQGTGDRRAAIYGVLQKFGLAGGGQPSAEPVPQVEPNPAPPPIRQAPVPILPPTDPQTTETPPIYIPPQAPPQPEPSQVPQQFPDIFNPIFF